MQLAEAAAEGLDADGSLWYELDPSAAHLIKEKQWWVQAEAAVGFFHAGQLTGDEKWILRSVKTWTFIQQHILDQQHGEWFWGVDENGLVMQGEDKVGLWKCPYHNARACLELLRRTGEVLERGLAKIDPVITQG